MKVSYNWILELVDVDWPPEEMARRLTLAGTACETVINMAERFDGMVVGEVLSVKPVPKADKLKLAEVKVGADTLQIICGAPNVAQGQKVAVALIGARLPSGAVLEKVSKFGVDSSGMLLSEAELELSADHSGIIELPRDAKVGQALAEALMMKDYSLEFELTPNRPDSISAIGIAREVAALSGKTVTGPEINVVEVNEKSADQIQVEIEDPDFCARYIGRIVKNVTIAPAPLWMKARLLASGVTPINNVVDITNYVLLETGQPLHAFDLSHFQTGKVVVKRASGKQEYVTLDEIEREIDESALMITNGTEYLAVGGVMGGLKSSITEETTDVLLESAYFDPSSIRKSRRKLGISTDASALFERGVDPNGAMRAIDRAAQLMGEITGGSVLRGAVDNYARKIEPLTISLRPSRCNQILGTQISSTEMASILKGLEFEVSGDDQLTGTVPTFRPDIEREIDLIEEIARIYGLENIPTTSGYLAYADQGESGEFRERAQTLREIRETFLACGYDEVLGSGLAEEKLLEEIDPGRPRILLENPVSDEFAAMRNSLLYSLLAAARTNITHQVTSIQLFEVGAIYGPSIAAEFHERQTIGALVSGKTKPFWRAGEQSPLDYYNLKGALDQIARQARLKPLSITPAKLPAFAPGAGYNLTCDKRPVGRLGQISTAIARLFDIKSPVFALELDFETLLMGRLSLSDYHAVPRFPSSSRDISMILEESTSIGTLLEGIQARGEGLIEGVDLFDLFRGEQIPRGKKSAAISIRFRSAEKSLESSEVDGLQQKIITYLKHEFKAEIRDH